MRHQGNKELLSGQKSTLSTEEWHERILLPLSKGGYKKVPSNCVEAVAANMPLHGVFSQETHGAHEKAAAAFFREFSIRASWAGIDSIPGIADQAECVVVPRLYLPDIFLAVPVLYAYKTKEEDRIPHRASLTEEEQRKKRLLHPAVRSLCDAFPNQQWRDLVQIFNRVCRTMQRYDGEAIPKHLAARLKHAAVVCDDIFIATPHHEVAVRDLEGVRAWLPERARNSYGIGIIRRLPYVVVLGKLNAGPLFSAYPAMVADTMEFLRENTKALKALNSVDRHLWYDGGVSSEISNGPLGTRLGEAAEKMVALFHKGFLFDWLREGYDEHGRTHKR